MKISKRLLKIAQMIDRNKVVFDVGSDHALLPCFLVMNDICDKVYAGEISEGPYQKSINNIEKYNLNGKVIPVLSDGLKEANDDVQVVVIAGMGYHTIKHILDCCDVNKYEYFIVQSNNDVDKLRKYLSNNNYTIEDEAVVYDDFYYQIIKFSSKYHDEYDYLQIKYGPVLLKNKDEEFIAYLKYYSEHLKQINLKANKDEYAKTFKEIQEILYN